MKILRTFDYDDPPRPADLAGVVFMCGWDDFAVYFVFHELQPEAVNLELEDPDR